MKKRQLFVFPLIFLFVFLIILFTNFFSNGFGFDSFVSEKIISVQGGNSNALFVFAGHYARTILIGISVLLFLMLYFGKRKKESFILAVSLILGIVLEYAIKFFVQKERPLVQLVSETGYSFPSGHAISSVILFTLLIYFYKDKIENSFSKYVFIFASIILIIFIGFSRIYLNVHWLSDVVGGYALGLFIAFSVMRFFDYYPKYL